MQTVVVRDPLKQLNLDIQRDALEYFQTGCFKGVLCFGPATIGSVASRTASSVASKYLVYRGVDANGVVKYVGITSREAEKRFAEHLDSIGTDKELLQYEAIPGLDSLSKTGARVQEQIQINLYKLEKDSGQLLNKINSIAEKYWDKLGIGE